jgi:hypothetical protein
MAVLKLDFYKPGTDSRHIIFLVVLAVLIADVYIEYLNAFAVLPDRKKIELIMTTQNASYR